MKGDITFGLDLGSDSLKAAFAYEVESGRFQYGKLAVSFFDDKFPACGYCTQDTGEWIFGEEIYSGNKNYEDFERIVRMKDLLKLNDGTPSSSYFDKNYAYPKFRPAFIEESKSQFDKSQTFSSRFSPKEVAEQFFAEYFRQYFTPAAELLLKRFPEMDYSKILGSKCIVAIPDAAVDEYAAELVRLVSASGFVSVRDKNYKTRRISETAALFAFAEKKLLENENALVADVGATGLTLSVVNGINLLEYLDVWNVGGADFDRDVFAYVKDTLDKKRGEEDGNYGTYYQLFNLELRIRNAKATLTTLGSAWTRVEVEGATTEIVPLTQQNFSEATNRTVKRITDLVTAAAKKANVKKIILSGGAAQTRGLFSAINASNRSRTVVIYDDGGRARADDIFDVYDRGTEFAPAVGAALFATKQYKNISRAPKAYGVETHDDQGLPYCSVIVSKNTVLPIRATRTFYTRGVTQTIKTTLYSYNGTKDLPLESKAQIDEYIKRGVIAVKDKGCEAYFRQYVSKDYPVTLEIHIDADGVGEVFAFDGKTGVKMVWSGAKFSTNSDFGKVTK